MVGRSSLIRLTSYRELALNRTEETARENKTRPIMEAG